MELRQWRIEHKKRLRQLSADTGIPMSSLSRIERGTQWPSAEQMLAIASATDNAVTAEDLAQFHAVKNTGEGAAA